MLMDPSMKDASYWIEQLQLASHPEGGFYKETYRSSAILPAGALPDDFSCPRNVSTAIYFLLRSGDRSLLHRIKSDELWHFHAGSSLDIYMLHGESLSMATLGAQVDKGESLQVVVPAGSWFGAKVRHDHTYTLSSCTVAPGFDFEDFELADREQLLTQYPQHADVITRLTK